MHQGLIAYVCHRRRIACYIDIYPSIVTSSHRPKEMIDDGILTYHAHQQTKAEKSNEQTNQHCYSPLSTVSSQTSRHFGGCQHSAPLGLAERLAIEPITNVIARARW